MPLIWHIHVVELYTVSAECLAVPGCQAQWRRFYQGVGVQIAVSFNALGYHDPVRRTQHTGLAYEARNRVDMSYSR